MSFESERSRPVTAGLLGLWIVLCLCAPEPAAAQWYASGSWGASEDLDAAGQSPVQTFRLGLQGYTDVADLRVVGGIPAHPSEDLLWASAQLRSSPVITLGERLALQPDLLTRGFLYHDPASELDGAGGLVSAEPYLAYTAPAVRIRLGGGVRAAGTRVSVAAAGSPVFSGVADTTITSTRSAGVVAGDLDVVAGRRVSLRARAEVLALDGASLPHGELLFVVSHDHGTFWASADRWESDEKRETGWQLGGSLDLTSALAARASVGRSSGDPMFGSTPTQTWSIGLRYRIADRPGRDRVGTLPEYESGAVALRVPVDAGEGRISVAGSFNGWTPVPMTRQGDDWTIRLDLAPGYYELAFVDESGNWFVPEEMAGRRPDGMGGWKMVLEVR